MVNCHHRKIPWKITKDQTWLCWDIVSLKNVLLKKLFGLWPPKRAHTKNKKSKAVYHHHRKTSRKFCKDWTCYPEILLIKMTIYRSSVAFGYQKGPKQKNKEKQSCSPSLQKASLKVFKDPTQLCWDIVDIIIFFFFILIIVGYHQKYFLKVSRRSDMIWLRYLWSKELDWCDGGGGKEGRNPI